MQNVTWDCKLGESKLNACTQTTKANQQSNETEPHNHAASFIKHIMQ